MGGKVKLAGGMGDYEYLRAAQVERKEMEAEHEVLVSTMLGLNGRVGVIDFVFSAYDSEAGPHSKPLASYRTEWPNATTMSFSATVFSAMVHLHTIVAGSRLSEMMAAANPR
jgi:hypothetical protein